MNYLIMNQLGTPEAPTADAVGIYLTEFLMDPDVIPLPRPIRDLLVKVLIVPRRKKASAEKYHKIWMQQGSPLFVHTRNQQQMLQNELGPEWKVVLGMRYGSPSLETALEQIPKSEKIYFLPMYPHYAQATVGSALNKLRSLTTQEIVNLEPFYQQEWYINAQAKQIQSALLPGDHLLLSYHGLPVSQNNLGPVPYQTQCLETSKAIFEILKISEDQGTTGFQSRLGPTRWIGPSTDEVTKALVDRGVKNLKVACPSFVADCLETLEEIGLGLKNDFQKWGGEKFELIPCFNDSPLFIQGLANYVRNHKVN